MSAAPLQTLLIPFETGQCDWPEGPVLFLNGERCAGLPPDTIIQQYFKPKADGAVPEIPPGPFAAILMLGSKQHQETLYFLGTALDLLTPGGLLVCAAANDAGGRRLKSDLQAIGLSPEVLSKYRSQVVWTIPGCVKAPAWVQEGEPKPILGGAFFSQPGIFGWDRVDAGSALLAGCLPEEALSGKGADFGCGYGYLADHVLSHQPGVSEISCLDADYRAVEACRRNLAHKYPVRQHYGWTDLTKPQAGLGSLDWIVMNPPFHEGKAAQAGIGVDFIKTAAVALKPGGHLWMVANAHLPYETTLGECFGAVDKIMEDRGFKVFHARK